MLTSLQIENFRTFRSLRVDGLGRFNLVVGLNDSGKTSLLAAAAFSENPYALASWANRLAHPGTAEDDVERVWRPLFHGAQTDLPITFTRTDSAAAQHVIQIRQGGAKRLPGQPASFTWGPPNQALDGRYELGDVVLDYPSSAADEEGWWSGTTLDGEADLIPPITTLYTEGRMDALADGVRRLHVGVKRVDLVGDALWVVLDGHVRPLPIAVLGDGSRRMIEFAIPVAQRTRDMYVDEIDNGFHWSTLGKVWSFLRESAIEQVFATTHREECIRIACETFEAAGDDSLRIIRLDRTADGHRAVVYTASAALAAMDAGLEIRG